MNSKLRKFRKLLIKLIENFNRKKQKRILDEHEDMFNNEVPVSDRKL